MSHRLLIVCGVFGFLNGVSAADLTSGPAAGKVVPAAKVLVLGADESYEERDIAASRADKTTVYVFVQAAEWSRPMARYLKGLDTLIRPIDRDAAVVAVWLTGNVDETKSYLPRARQSLKFEATTLAVFPGDNLGPADWQLDSKASLTTVVVRRGKVVRSFAYVSLNETDLPPVKKLLEETAP